MQKPQIPRFVTFILNRLKDSGHQGYIAGGAVRDACLGRHAMDWDVTTSASVDEIKTLFSDTRFFALKHETVTLVDEGRHFEVTAFRGRENSIEDDLAHRDFTINAMAYDMEKAKILDFHNGRKDITRKLIKATENPKERFKEDPLRILRAVRLAAEFNFRIEANTRDAMKDMAPMLLSIAPERIRDELMKILMSHRPSTGFKMMRSIGLLEHIIPELLEGYMKQQNSYHKYTVFRHLMETVDIVEPEPILRLAALFHDIAKPRVREKIKGEWRFYGHEKASAELAQEIMERFRFSKDMIRRTTGLIRHHMIDYDSKWTDGAVRRLIRRVGTEQVSNLLTFRKADILAHGLQCHRSNLLAELQDRVERLTKNPVVTKTRDLAIDGQTVMDILGISPGDGVGNALNKLIEKVTDNPRLNTEKRLTAILENMKTE